MTTPSLSRTPVVILCGGQGTRLREHTENLPKPMVEIGDQPILWHIMKHYGEAGLRRFVLCLGYKGWAIKQYFLRYHEMRRDFTVSMKGDPPRGPLPQPGGRGGLAGHLRRDRRRQRHGRPAQASSRATSTPRPSASPTVMLSARWTSRRWWRSIARRAGSRR
ncbi:MAG: sugar phosphate nucleotidyltransferase [Thermoanaerobaculia bacterium]